MEQKERILDTIQKVMDYQEGLWTKRGALFQEMQHHQGLVDRFRIEIDKLGKEAARIRKDLVSANNDAKLFKGVDKTQKDINSANKQPEEKIV